MPLETLLDGSVINIKNLSIPEPLEENELVTQRGWQALYDLWERESASLGSSEKLKKVISLANNISILSPERTQSLPGIQSVYRQYFDDINNTDSDKRRNGRLENANIHLLLNAKNINIILPPTQGQESLGAHKARVDLGDIQKGAKLSLLDSAFNFLIGYPSYSERLTLDEYWPSIKQRLVNLQDNIHDVAALDTFVHSAAKARVVFDERFDELEILPATTSAIYKYYEDKQNRTREKGSAYYLASFAASLKLLTAKSITKGRHGLEIEDYKKENFLTLPPMPQSKKY